MTDETNGAAADEQRRPLTLGGEPVHLKPFMAFKAMRAMKLVKQLRRYAQPILAEGGRFKREYEAEHYVELPRAEARRQFPPRVLTEQVPIEHNGAPLYEDGELVVVRKPMIRDGEPVLGPDPIGHITEDDWRADGNVLKVPESPPDSWLRAVMAAEAVDVADEIVLRLLALVMADDDELEKWDLEPDTDVDSELTDTAKRLPHKARADELVRLLMGAAMHLAEQLGDSLNEVKADLGKLQALMPGATGSEAAPEPMTIESSSGEQTSSTSSPADTTGDSATSSTEPPGDSSES